jgi:hypothetical protein
MSRRRDGLLAICLFALLFSVYLLTFSGVFHSSDEMSMLAVTDSLARRGAWDIELLRWMGEQQGSFGPDGLLYSRKGIGTTLVALPHYWLALQSARLGNVQVAMLTNSVLTALTGVLVYLLLRHLEYRIGVSLGTAVAFGLGTMAWPYARYLFSETLAGLGLMLSAYSIVRYGGLLLAFDQDENSPAQAREDEKVIWVYPVLAGTGLGLALLSRLNNAIVAPFLGLLLLHYLYRIHGWDWRKWIKPVTLFALPVLVAVLIIGWYNWLRFGDPLTTGYLPEESFATPFLEGFYGLTFSPGKGVFWYNPLLLAAMAAWPFFLRRHRTEALLVAAVVLSNVAFYAPWYLWWAGHSWGPRFLVTILPFAVLSLAPALDAAGQSVAATIRRRVLAASLGALAVLSLAVQLLGVAVDFNLYLEDIFADLGLYHPATLFTAAYSPLLRQIGYLRPDNLDLAWARNGSIDWVACLVGLGLILVSGLALWAFWRRRPRSWIAVGLLALLALGAVSSLMRYAPVGDVAQATNALAVMERPGEAAALTDPLLTEPFQDAYDGRLWVWGVPSQTEVGANQEATWTVGSRDPSPAAARFQIGTLRLGYQSLPGTKFEATRLPVPVLKAPPSLGTVAELIAFQSGETSIHAGEMLSLALYWRALDSTATSYTVFVQTIDQDGIKAGQVDRLPCKGGCPTNTWRSGDLIGERYDLLVHTDALPGRYQLVTGMYDLATGENLTWSDAQGNDLGSYLPIGTIVVEPQE